MNTKDIEELKDEAVNIWVEQDIYQALDYVITTLTQHHEAEVERAVEDIIKMADALEIECGKDGDKGTKQWMAFKGFRNAVRDKYLTPTKTDKTTEV